MALCFLSGMSTGFLVCLLVLVFSKRDNPTTFTPHIVRWPASYSDQGAGCRVMMGGWLVVGSVVGCSISNWPQNRSDYWLSSLWDYCFCFAPTIYRLRFFSFRCWVVMGGYVLRPSLILFWLGALGVYWESSHYLLHLFLVSILT